MAFLASKQRSCCKRQKIEKAEIIEPNFGHKNRVLTSTKNVIKIKCGNHCICIFVDGIFETSRS